MENGQTTVYLALGHTNLYEKTGTVATKHIFAGSQRIAEVQDGVISYFHNDHLGSPRAVTNTSGTLIATTATRPFGQSHSANNPTDYLFTGKELDGAGLYYFAARYYDPSVGRFVTEDSWQGTLAEPWTQNRYVYVGNNPLGYVDPTGHSRSTPGVAIALSWLPGIDLALPFGDIAYIVIVGTTAVAEYGPLLYDKVAATIDYIKQTIKNGRGSGNSSGGTSSSTPDPDDWDISSKKAMQMDKRGWTSERISETIRNPHTTREAVNKANGNPATAYYNAEGSYVVRDNITREILQMSDRLNLSWIPDSSIIDPFLR